MIDLDAIRARDRDYDDVFEAQANMSKDIAHRLVAWPVADRRALLAYVDALRAAAGKVKEKCYTCDGYGFINVGNTTRQRAPCPDCADLRALLTKGKQP